MQSLHAKCSIYYMQALRDQSNTRKEKNAKAGDKGRRKRIIIHDSSSDEETSMRNKKMKNSETMRDQKPDTDVSSVKKSLGDVQTGIINDSTTGSDVIRIDKPAGKIVNRNTTDDQKTTRVSQILPTTNLKSVNQSKGMASSELHIDHNNKMVGSRGESLSYSDLSDCKNSSQLSLLRRPVAKVKPIMQNYSESDSTKQDNGEWRSTHDTPKSGKTEQCGSLDRDSNSLGFSLQDHKREETPKAITTISTIKPHSWASDTGSRPLTVSPASTSGSVPRTALTHPPHPSSRGSHVFSTGSKPSTSPTISPKQVNECKNFIFVFCIS